MSFSVQSLKASFTDFSFQTKKNESSRSVVCSSDRFEAYRSPAILRTAGHVAAAGAMTWLVASLPRAGATEPCPSECYRSASADAMANAIAIGVATIACAPAPVTEILCRAAAAGSVAAYLKWVEIHCSAVGCGPFISP